MCGHEVGAVLPEVFCAVREVGDDENPGGLDDADGGEDKERSRDACLDGDDFGSAVADREAYVDGGDQRDGEGMDGCEVQPPEAKRHDDVGHPEQETPEDRRSHEARGADETASLMVYAPPDLCGSAYRSGSWLNVLAHSNEQKCHPRPPQGSRAGALSASTNIRQTGSSTCAVASGVWSATQ